jgi:hypothetical protein
MPGHVALKMQAARLAKAADKMCVNKDDAHFLR